MSRDGCTRIAHAERSTTSSVIGGGIGSEYSLRLAKYTFHRVLNIRNGFVAGAPLRYAAGKRGTFGDKKAIFILLNDNSVEHIGMFTRLPAHVNAENECEFQKLHRL